jgi:hypothetical protein
MSVAFASRNPSKQEVEQLRLVLSTFRDGSGMIAVGDETFPGWRDFERAVAAVLGGKAPETKGVFDVVVPSTQTKATDYGLSIKSKALTLKGGLTNLAKDGRVYMELANSPAKFLKALEKIDFKEANFKAKKRPQEVGDIVLKTVTSWHDESVKLHEGAYHRTLDLKLSRYLVLSYCLPKGDRKKDQYQWHSFNLNFPENIVWKYASKKCLRGFDPAHPKEALFDFYLLSGGQLKYYPRASTSVFSSEVFELAEPRKTSTLLRAARMYPHAWIAAGGKSEFTANHVSEDLLNMSHLAPDEKIRRILDEALEKIRHLVP